MQLNIINVSTETRWRNTKAEQQSPGKMKFWRGPIVSQTWVKLPVRKDDYHRFKLSNTLGNSIFAVFVGYVSAEI